MRRSVDRYDLLEEVGSGGMAVVHRGRDTALDREVAVKLLHPHLAARPEARARFSREARAVARLAHPNIVEIYDFAGEAAVESYLVTEFVRGRTLRAFADEVGVGFPEIGALIVRALADALVHAHGAGVIHRDLKPENVLVSEEGRRTVKLVDFGIARILAGDERMTMTGALVGSPNHMAPEIIEGREADARSDLFSLGTILYWLATGELPFEAPNPTATLRRVLEGDARDPREVSPLVSDELARAISGALATDPDQRTASAVALRDQLDALLAEVGLEDPVAELPAFLTDPAGYRAAFPARLTRALLARGEAALVAGSTARALSLFNRVLAVDPENTRVTAHLDRMARRARLRRTVRSGAASLAVLLVVAGSAIGVRRAASQRSAEARLAARGAEAHAGGSAAARPRATAAGEGRRSETPSGPGAVGPEASRGPVALPPASPPPATGGTAAVGAPSPGERPHATVAAPTLAILVRPYAQRALLDGVEVASNAQRVVFTLARGRAHRLQIEHPCCEPFIRDIPASAALPPTSELRVPLAPKPARLRVQAEPQARVFLDERLVGTAGESQRTALAVPIPSNGASPYEGTAEIRIEAPGHSPHVTIARLRAGAELTIVAPRTLRPPPVEERPPAELDAVTTGVPASPATPATGEAP